MGLSDLYYKLEEKYYASLDWFDSKGLHFFYNFDAWLQSKNIPSFPIMTLLLLIFIAVVVLVILYFLGVLGTSMTVNLQLVNSKDNYTMANISFMVNDSVKSESYVTDSSGEAKVKVRKNIPFYVTINSSEYILENSEFTAYESNELIKVYLKSSSALLSSKVLKIFENFDSGILFSEAISVNLTCTGNSNYNETIEILSGVRDLSDLPEDCGNLEVSVDEYNYSKSYNLANHEFEVAVDIAVPKGTIIINVLNNSLEPISNVQVTAYSNNVRYAESLTSESGVVQFELDAVRDYTFTLNHLGQDYSTLVTSNMESECNGKVLKNETKTCSLTMLATNIGKINLEIYDVSGKPITNATIKVLKNNVEHYNYNLTAGDAGKFIFGVPELSPYRIVIDSFAYMIFDKEIMPSNTPTKINLEPVLDSPVLNVLVLANGDPVAKANVQLYKENNLILTKVTGADGIAYFDRLEKDVPYSVKVLKSDYSQSSEPLILNPRIENTITVNMVVGKGNVNVYGYNKQGVALDGLTAEIYDVYTNRKLGEAQLKEGLATIYGVSADKTVYAKLVSDSGVGYSLVSDIKANFNSDLIVYFSDYSNNFTMENIGIFNLDGSSVYTVPYQVVENNEYYGLFLLNVPKGAFNESEILFVGGIDLENANILIKDAKMLNAKLEKGLTYTSPLGFAEDMLNKTQDDGIWAQLKASNLNPGTYIVKVNFIIDSDPKSQLFNLGYRASLKSGGTYLRYPIDNVLGQNESASNKLGFYSELAKNVNFRIGSLNCVNSGCIEMTAQDAQGNRTKVYDELYSVYNLSTDLTFKIISAQKTTYNDLVFEIASLNNGLDISNVNLRSNSNNLIVQKTTNKYTTKLNEFGPNVELNGNINFAANKSGTNILKITIYNNKNEEIFTKEIAVTVDAPKDLRVEYLPALIVPYVNNLGAVFVSDALDSTPVEAHVSAYLNDVLIGSGVTDFEGKIPLEITKPSSGDSLKLKATAPGYNAIESELKITENILIADVPEITYNINIDELDYLVKNITFTTPLPNKLKIQRISFTNNEFNKFLEVKHNLRANYEFEKTLSLELSAKLTTDGKNLLEPKTINTFLDLVVTSNEINEVWNVKVPVTFYIQLYDSLDSVDCLKLEVSNDDLSAEEYGFKLINTCTYNEVATELYNVKTFVEWSENKLGEFEYDKKIIDSEGMDLFESISKSTSYSLLFKPSSKISSGKSKANFIVKAYYRTNSGLQELVVNKELDIIYSKLSNCLKITTSDGTLINPSGVNNPIVVGVSPFGMGMNAMNGLYGNSYNPYLTNSYGSANIVPNSASNLWDQLSSTSNTQGNFSTAANLASLNSNSGVGSNNVQQMMLMLQMMGGSYGGMNPQMYLAPTSNLTITNTCAYDVDVQVGAAAQIMVSPNSSTITIGSNSQVTVTANSLPGIYNLNILAGYNGNLNPFAVLPINVIDYASETVQDDCFKIEGEPTLDMSSFTKNYKQLKIYNYCFSKGVVFDDANPIELNALFAAEDLVMKDKDGKDVKVLDKGQKYAELKIIKSPQIETSNTYGKYQYIELLILKNSAIQEVSFNNYAGTNTLSDTAQSLSVLRSAATALNQNVNFKALVTINSRIGYGMTAQKKAVVKTLTIRDLWNLLALAGAGELDAGNRTCTPNKWSSFIDDDISYSVKYSQIKDRIPLNNESWDLLDKDCFGSYDNVKFKDDYLEQTSNGITVKLTPHFKDRKLYFDIDVKGSGDKFESTYDFGYTLQSYWHSETPLQKRDRTLKFILTITDVTAGDPAKDPTADAKTQNTKDEFCIDKFGNEWKSLSTYGFGSLEGFNNGNMLSFDYRTTVTPDCTKTFCDAEQLKKYLKGKFTTSLSTNIVYETYLSQKYVVKNATDKNVIELLPSKVLDKVSMYFLEKYLAEAIADTAIETTGFDKFKNLVKEMPNLFLVTTSGCYTGTTAYGFTVVGSNKCYYNAQKMSQDASGQTYMKDIFKGAFDVVFLVPETKWMLIGFNQAWNVKVETVYLKPDNYKMYFEGSNFLSYDANVFGVEVKNPGIYLIQMDLNAGKEVLRIQPAEYFIDQTYKANTIDRFFYSLPIDPTRDGFVGTYNGQFGLCTKANAMDVLSFPQINTCLSTNKNVNKLTFASQNYLEINYTNYDYIVNFPSACKNNSTCEINGNNSFKVTAPKNAYTLENIFNTPQNYCYSESNNIVKVVYSGEQR